MESNSEMLGGWDEGKHDDEPAGWQEAAYDRTPWSQQALANKNPTPTSLE